ncbi:MAG: hypothetical protein ABIR66_09825 [Saprospiraceae bacterium]
MLNRTFWALLFLSVLLPPVHGQSDHTQAINDSLQISLIYTGQSLGAFGVIRSQEEHELVTEQANTEHLPFKLVSHACWRAHGLVVFLPSTEPKGNELSKILEKRNAAKKLIHQRALMTQNVLLVQDPRRTSQDMLNLLKRNPRTALDFPEMEETEVSIYVLTIKDEQAFIIESPGAIWPVNENLWTLGEINRIDLGDSSRLFEMPFNLGEIAVRSNVIKKLLSESGSFHTILDLGQRTGQFGMKESEQAFIDYSILDFMGYTISLPYHFELSLAADTLKQIKIKHPAIRFLATNIRTKDSSLFYKHLIESYGSTRLGYIGLVDPTLQGDLAKGSLEDFRFIPTLESVKAEIKILRNQGVDAIIVLSNMDAVDNALLSQEVSGIDVILADLQKNWSFQTIEQSILFPSSQINKQKTPAFISRSFTNGLGVGLLKLKFNTAHHLSELNHTVSSVSDHIPMDTMIYNKLSAMDIRKSKPKGDLLFPAFIDILSRHPELKNFDNITQQGRVSQELWEEFVARLIRRAAPAEIAILRKFPSFPSLIGKLHQDEVRAWLWTEEDIILCDVKGNALLKLLSDDVRRDLIMSGLSRPLLNLQRLDAGISSSSPSTDWYLQNVRIMGRRIDPDAYYRIATTDVVFEGIRAADFTDSKRIRRYFTVDKDGRLVPDAEHKTLSIRTFILNELKRLRKSNKSETNYLDAIADRLIPDPSFERLLTFNFDRPTLWSSYNRKFNSSAYGNVPESRISATNSWVIGTNGGIKAILDGQHYGLDMGLSFAYATQNSEITKTTNQITESSDDIKIDLTYRYKSKSVYHPFVRSQYDTEFTPTINPNTFEKNYRQQALRGVIGFTRNPLKHWRNLELASLLEQDFGQNKIQVGITGKAQAIYPISKNGVLYSLKNDATYFFKARQDTNRDLAIKYNMIHEIIVPLVDELALSVGADFLFYKGKVAETKDPGMSMLLKVGLTYDRKWKPRYQPLF